MGLEDETSTVGNEQGGTAEGERDIQLGAVVAILSFTVMLPGLSFSSAVAKGPENWRLDILMLFAFASCICGLSFMLLSMQLLGAPETRASLHRIISRCLFYACIALPALTILSLLLVMPFKLFLYVGLAVPPLVVVTVAGVHWYVKSRSEGTTKPDITAELKEQEKEMESNSKITGALMASSFGGLVGTLAALDKQSGDTGGDTLRGTHVAIMFMFSTAVTSVLLMVLSMVALKIESRVHRRSIVGAIRHANVILLGLIAVAAFSAAFVVLRFYILTAFVSVALAAMVQFIIEHCTTAKVDADEPVEGRQDDSNDVHPDPDPIQETQLGWMADIGKQVTAWSLGGVMVIFGRFIGDSDKNHDKAAANKTCMFLLTSAFASGLGLMFLMNFGSGGRPARVVINAATNILACSALGMIAAAALAIYGVVVIKS